MAVPFVPQSLQRDQAVGADESGEREPFQCARILPRTLAADCTTGMAPADGAVQAALTLTRMVNHAPAE